MAKRISTLVEDIEEAQELEISDDDQGELFPELDRETPEHKKALVCAKKYRKAKQSRDEILSTAKEEVDEAREALIVAMKAIGFKKFRSNGIKAMLIEGRDKVRVTAED